MVQTLTLRCNDVSPASTTFHGHQRCVTGINDVSRVSTMCHGHQRSVTGINDVSRASTTCHVNRRATGMDDIYCLRHGPDADWTRFGPRLDAVQAKIGRGSDVDAECMLNVKMLNVKMLNIKMLHVVTHLYVF